MSTTYRLYQEARNAAWRTLLRFSVSELPVDPRRIAESLRIPVLPFPTSDQEPLLHSLVNRNPRAVCVSLCIQGVWHIFLREPCGEECTAFGIAHELGHMILRHSTVSLAPKILAFQADENEGDVIGDPQEIEDYAADIFAVRLLAPACVLHEMHIDQSGDIARLCRMPRKAAMLRAERMELLNRRDAFYADPMEKKLVQQFTPYIRAQALPSPIRSVPAYAPNTTASSGERKPASGTDTAISTDNECVDRHRSILLPTLLSVIALVFVLLASLGVFR